MRTSSVLLALPALSCAQQIPYLEQIKGFFTTKVSHAASGMPTGIPNPLTAATGKIAEVSVPQLTLANHKELIKPGAATASPGIETWMVYVTGGNKTCFGTCGRAEEAFNGSVVLIEASPTAPNLAYLNCDQDQVLCAAWAVSPPNVLHMQLPQPLPDQSQPPSTVRAIQVNRTTITTSQIAAIHLEDKYLDSPVYEGFWHPFNGPLADYGLNVPAGYAIWAFSVIPSWAFMIGISMISRNIMSRRAQAPPARRSAGAPPAAAAPATANIQQQDIFVIIMAAAPLLESSDDTATIDSATIDWDAMTPEQAQARVETAKQEAYTMRVRHDAAVKAADAAEKDLAFVQKFVNDRNNRMRKFIKQIAIKEKFKASGVKKDTDDEA
ncbi:hypothetical protein B0A48_06447 [Cryoendolithus antarcticus]|uniref:Uncharacterized protein n=1 Tax=Cryoendolithus antarcticus TaxID=1507870 RepID=A0A1V8TAX7_9PEZI|nr:hypothetical protein B0A48_06447 [Cryoendolithus antarcticus]